MANHHGRRNELSAKSLETAIKRGEAWTKEEDDLLRSSSSRADDLLAAAQLVGRTYGAVVVRYYKIRTADRKGALIRYGGRNVRADYPVHTRTKTRVYIAPACACADPWDHRAWCPDNTTIQENTDAQAA